ncbi:hypothetical protein ABW20_dc0102166 [Dactylellina cionopaga]|nr:hypothetical protein ABW20_dc0102166 [Dactylellina cionopaga]
MVPVHSTPSLAQDYCLRAAGNGITPYGISKLLGESLVHRFAASHCTRRAIIFRLFNPVSCDPSGHLSENPRDERWCGGNVMRMVLKTLKKGENGNDGVFEIYGTDYQGSEDGSCVRDFVHVSDIARGIAMGFEALISGATGDLQGENRCKVYNLASGKGVSVKQLIRQVEKESGLVVRTKECARREGDVAVSIGSIEKAGKELGWMPEKGFEDVCKDFCRCYGIGSSSVRNNAL